MNFGCHTLKVASNTNRAYLHVFIGLFKRGGGWRTEVIEKCIRELFSILAWYIFWKL